MRIAFLAVLSAGCLAAAPSAVPLYPNSEVERLPPNRVANLSGPIARIDGRDVPDVDGPFELLPGCHVVELLRQMPDSGFGLSSGVYVSGQFPPMVYALRMLAGARYSIRRDLLQLGAGQTTRLVVTAREELPDGVVREFSPAQSEADVAACKAWEAGGQQGPSR